MIERVKDMMPAEEVGEIVNLYNAYPDVETCTWLQWADERIMTPFHYDPLASFSEILVPTEDTTCYNKLLHTLQRNDCNALCMAETGVGKSVVMQQFLDQCVAEGSYVSHSMGYSAQTTPTNLKDIMEGKLDKKRKNLLGPPAGKKMLYFVDDLNMPALEVYGAQPPNELLRQIIDSNGFYDTAKLFFKYVQDMVFAGAMAPPGGGRNEVSPRLLRHFNMIWMPQLSENSMTTIFTAIMKGFCAEQLPDLVAMADPLVKSSVEIYKRVEHEMLPTPEKSHYTFNLRDLSKVFQGVLMIVRKDCPDERELCKLWLHEEARVFRDRLINEGDKTMFNHFCCDMLTKYLNIDDMTEDDFKDVLFGDYLTREDKHYCEVSDIPQLNDLLLEYLEEYNITFPSQMHLVFF
jgi:dynein heavy chain